MLSIVARQAEIKGEHLRVFDFAHAFTNGQGMYQIPWKKPTCGGWKGNYERATPVKQHIMGRGMRKQLH